VPLGAQFQVNDYTTGTERLPRVARSDAGSFVVVWDSNSSPTDTDGDSVHARLFASDGTPQGPQFQVNSYTTGSQYYPAVGMDAGGQFVVVWRSYTSPDDPWQGIRGQRYASDGTPVAVEFQVNANTSDWQSRAAVDVEADGDFVVAWTSYATGDGRGDIHFRRFASDGTPLGGDFQVNTYTIGYQTWPSVGVRDSGEFVIVWKSSYSYVSDGSVWGRRFASDGSAIGAEFALSSYTTGDQRLPRVDMDPTGAFVVAWYSDGSAGTDTDGDSVQARLFASSGTPIGAEFQVNTYTTDDQNGGHVAVADAGGFIVSWGGWGPGGFRPQLQRFTSDGVRVGSELHLENGGSLSTAVDEGGFVAIWQYGEIQGRRYASPIFADDFESGDTTAWSAVIP
jgi:hypothetical protein